MKISRWMVALAATTAVSTALPAFATPFTFSFAGILTDDPYGLLGSDTSFNGSYTFDSEALDLVADPSTGVYQSSGAGYGFQSVVGGTAYSILGSLFVNVANDFAGSVDQYGVIAIDGGLTLELFFQDNTGTAFGTDGLPLSAPLLANFGFAQFRLFGDGVEFLGRTELLTCTFGCGGSGGGGGGGTEVPEPGTAVLLLGALGLLVVARRSRRDGRSRVAGVAAVLACAAALPAHAIDGVVLIDQNKALMGNVAPGDAAGFPVTINTPGSYRLSGNLTVPNADTTAIEITANSVTLDLNGFSIVGPAVCTFNNDQIGVRCSGGGNGYGVLVNAYDAVIQNGTIRGMGMIGIMAVNNPVIQDMRVLSTAGGVAGVWGAIQTVDGVVRRNTVRGNAGTAITLTGRGVISDNFVSYNGNGLYTNGGTVVSGNSVTFSGFQGLSCDSASFTNVQPVGFSNNVFVSNGVDGNQHALPVAYGRCLNLGQNQCGVSSCP